MIALAMQLPAQLIIGPHAHAHETIKQDLMQLLCTYKGCTVCTVCRAVRDEQYHAITWIHPKSMYALEDLDPIFNTLSFALEDNQHHFFILCKADFLTQQCFNRLLKPLEEPPKNYHFILIAERTEYIAPTVRSRCIISTLLASDAPCTHERLAQFFLQTGAINPALFYKELESSKINDQETHELLDYLLKHWVKKAQAALEKQDIDQYEYAQRRMHTIQNGLLHAPMPGSSSVFWKNIMLEMQELHHKK